MHPAADTSSPAFGLVGGSAGTRDRIVGVIGRPALFDVTVQGLDRVAVAVSPEIVVAVGRLRARADSALLAACRRFPEALVVACAPRTDGRAVRWAIEHGAHAVAWEEHLDTTLELAVRGVAAGLLVVPGEMRRAVAPPEFTTREKQVLGLVIMGLTNGEIGQKLYLTEHTVKSHLGSAFRKLGVRSRAEAARMITDPEAGLGTGILAITDAGHARR